MQIVDFMHDHIKAAEQLAKQNYGEERDFAPGGYFYSTAISNIS